MPNNLHPIFQQAVAPLVPAPQVMSLTRQVMARQDARHTAALIRADQAEGHVAQLLKALDYIESVLSPHGPVEGCGKELIRRKIMNARRDVMGAE